MRVYNRTTFYYPDRIFKCNTLAFALAFVSALMCSAEMLAGYCNNNPACSIRSFAIIPALAAVAAAVLDFVHMFKSAGVDKAQA